MSAWPGKYVIGLTGNIATGKSVVRKMLEHLGAFGIDADALAHRAMASAGPAFKPILQTFGNYILTPEGQIDRGRLGSIVFNDPHALQRLEDIVHPFVSQAIDLLAGRSKRRILVIEAIKLLEGELAGKCDVIWVVDSPTVVQQARMMRKRNLSAEEALTRIQAQNPQKDKLAHAGTIINNAGTFGVTWEQVQSSWINLPAPESPEQPEEDSTPDEAGVSVRRGRASDAAAIAEFINTVGNTDERRTREDVIASFGQKAYFLAFQEEELAAVIGWQVENLVTRADELHTLEGVSPAALVRSLTREVEQASADLQSEAAFLFLEPGMYEAAAETLETMGYKAVEPDDIKITAWSEAMAESQPPDTTALFKKLREDRVLRPV